MAAPGLAQLVTNAINQRGQPILLRTAQMGASGPVPPILTDPVLAATAAEGATTIAINCGSATGELVAGDRLTIGGQVVVVKTGAVSRPLAAGVTPGFDGLVIEPPLAAAAAAGTPIAIRFAADKPMKAMVNSFSVRVVDGVNIEARDLQVQIGAYGPTAPDPATQKLIVQGDIRTIVNVTPVYGPGGVITKWTLQAR